MKNIGWFSRFLMQPTPAKMMCRAMAAMAAALLVVWASQATAQNPASAAAPAPESQMSIPTGYTAHYSVDVGGRVTNTNGSGSMYDTLVNLQTGPRILGATFELHAQPGNKHTLVDDLSAFASGFGGDPYDLARLDASKGNAYEFSGLFRRDRQYFDYDLLGNPNIPGGQTIPISPTGAFAWPQVLDSPFLFNTVRRMTDTHLTIHPLSVWTFRFGYSQNVMQGPTLSPSGYQIASSHDMLLSEYQRNSSDDFFGAIDWKPAQSTKLSFEEQVDHYKANSYFTLDRNFLRVQEEDGTPVTLLANYDSFSPYGASSCNTAARGGNPILTSPSTGTLPVIDPSCSVATSYLRTQPTRVLLPTEIFRFQSSAIKNVSMNGNVRYTQANMNLPAYTDTFNGLITANPSATNPTPVATREIAYVGDASAKREVIAADYGIYWQVAPRFSLSEQATYSNAHEPGTANFLSGTTVTTAAGVTQTINSTPLTTTLLTSGSTFEGSPGINSPLPDYFGQSWFTNNLTGSWNASSWALLSLTYRYTSHVIAQGIPHNAPLAVAATTDGTVSIDENGGILNVALHPTSTWDVNGSAEIAYADNAFTPVAPRQLQRYRVHTIYRPQTWLTINGSYSDLERHNNTNNNAAAVALYNTSGGASGDPYEGPLDHVDHTRIVSVGGTLDKSQYYGFDFNYSFSDVYTATNICYDGVATALSNGTVAPGAATGAVGSTGSVCSAGSAHGSYFIDYGPARDFMDAPTQFGYAALMLTPIKTVKADIGYTVSDVNGSRFFNDARDVNGSLVSTYQSPYVNLAYALRPGLTWMMQYNFYGYGEGGPSGAQDCNASTTTPGTIQLCSSLPNTALTGPVYGSTAPRNFHANDLLVGVHYQF